MGEELIRLNMSKDELGVLLDALEHHIDDIDNNGGPADWERGAKLYHLKVSYARLYLRFNAIVAEQTGEDEG